MSSDLSEQAILAGLTTSFIGRPLQYYAEVASTQDLAKEQARRGAPEGTACLADHQTAGRGRLGRRWDETSGSSLLLSVLLKPAADLYPRLAILGAVAVAQAIEDITGLNAGLKWPNDVLIEGKKVAGVLVEGEFEADVLLFAVIGIGINVNLDPADLPAPLYPATSLKQQTGANVSRSDLARALLVRLEQGIEHARAGAPVDREWRARLTTLGQRVRVRIGERVEEGVAEDVGSDGTLVLLRDDGSRISLLSGDVTLRA